MSRKYRLGADRHVHFVTFTVIDWIDFFIRNEYKEVFIKAIKHYQENNGPRWREHPARALKYKERPARAYLKERKPNSLE